MDQLDHDLDLAVELVNTHWVLADPPDRLSVPTYQRALRDAGDRRLAVQLKPHDLDALRALRDDLAAVFAAATAEQAVRVLDSKLRDAVIPTRLAARDGTAQWSWGADQHGVTALRARLLTALAAHMVRHGATRMGVCHAEPCQCVYIDRSRARTRRYCCDQCNDRSAAAAYRRRQRR